MTPKETGANPDDILALGRLLAADLQTHDLRGHWMATHLAQLITAADGPDVSTEQRTAIIKLTLKVWRRRHTFPGGGPLADFAPVLSALERLDDDSPFGFVRPFQYDIDTSTFTDPSLAHITMALNLERVVLDSVRTLLWLQVQQAAKDKSDWLDTAQKVGDAIEVEVLQRLRSQVRRRREAVWQTSQDEPADIAEGDSTNPADSADLEAQTLAAHAGDLRRMAQRLLEVADHLTPDTPHPASR